MKKQLYIKKVQVNNDLQETFDNPKYVGPVIIVNTSKELKLVHPF